MKEILEIINSINPSRIGELRGEKSYTEGDVIQLLIKSHNLGVEKSKKNVKTIEKKRYLNKHHYYTENVIDKRTISILLL